MPSFPCSWPHLKKGLANSAAWERQTNNAICNDSHIWKSKPVTSLTTLQLFHLDFSSVAPSLQQLDCLEPRRKVEGSGFELSPATMQTLHRSWRLNFYHHGPNSIQIVSKCQQMVNAVCWICNFPTSVRLAGVSIRAFGLSASWQWFAQVVLDWNGKIIDPVETCRWARFRNKGKLNASKNSSLFVCFILFLSIWICLSFSNLLYASEHIWSC